MSAVAGIRAGLSGPALAPVRGLVMLLLWGIFTIHFPVLFGLGLALGLFLLLAQVGALATVDRINGLVLINVLYWSLSGFLIGGLSLAMLASPAYYANEGRIFLAYLPLVVLSCSAVSRSTLGVVVRQLVLLALAGLLLYAAWALAKPSLLSVGRGHNFAGLMTSHTGSGTFFAELGVFLAIYGSHVRSRRHTLLGALMILPVLGSGSREALVALAAVLLWWMRGRLSAARVLVSLVLVVVLVASMPVIAPHTYARTAQLFDAGTFRHVAEQIESSGASHWEPGEEKDLSGEEFNILSRVLYWTYAVRRFQDSPFLGDGFGRFNDHHLRFAGTPGLVYVAVDAQNNPATLHAHNSYLMLLCETGLAGLALLLWLWVALWRRVRRAARETEHDPALQGYFLASQGLIVFVMVAALFGHALAAPINLIPALTVIGAGLSFMRTHGNSSRRAGVDGEG